MNKVIEALIAEELARANLMHRARFASMHEGESVLREEAEEARDELADVEFNIERLWESVKARQNPMRDIANIRLYATRAIIELIQVAAMCDKWELSFKEEKDGQEIDSNR